jgi:predicted Rossmann fold flavoprotein
MQFDVIIIGAGASGLMCAITAAQRGRRVLVLDSSNKVGKKILMSGGGRCNFTNLYIESDCFLSNNPHFCKSALSQYTQWDFISLVEKHAIAYEERDHGQLFCKESAKDILAMLLKECNEAGVQIRTHCETHLISTVPEQSTSDSKFKLESNQGKFESKSLVIASGGLSIPKMGATNYAYKVAQQFDMPVIDTSAGLVPFTFTGEYKTIFERLSGISHKVNLSTGKKQFYESILFTHRGLSGPAALQLSSYWKQGETIVVNLFPNNDISEILHQTKKQKPTTLLRNLLSQHLAKKLVQELETLFWSDWQDKVIADIPDKVLNEIALNLSDWRLKPSGTEGYRTAEVTLGGVDTDYLSSKTMESKTQQGLYFIGEAVDVTGHLGGFNFQWAWSSGYVAGLSV